MISIINKLTLPQCEGLFWQWGRPITQTHRQEATDFISNYVKIDKDHTHHLPQGLKILIEKSEEERRTKSSLGIHYTGPQTEIFQGQSFQCEAGNEDKAYVIFNSRNINLISVILQGKTWNQAKKDSLFLEELCWRLAPDILFEGLSSRVREGDGPFYLFSSGAHLEEEVETQQPIPPFYLRWDGQEMNMGMWWFINSMKPPSDDFVQIIQRGISMIGLELDTVAEQARRSLVS